MAKDKHRAIPKGIELIDRKLLERLKDAHRHVHPEINDEHELSLNFIESCEHFRNQVNPAIIRNHVGALLKHWVEHKKQDPTAILGGSASFSGPRGT